MKTLLRIGPRDHGRTITDDEMRCAEYVPGYKYELIDGRLYVTYEPDPSADWIEKWLYIKVWVYSQAHPGVINYVTDKARIFVPGHARRTIPEPDLAAYSDFPMDLPLSQIHWQAVSPFLVGEVMSADSRDKDLVRNVELFLQVPSIKEYWIIDPGEDPDQPTMLVYRRRGQRWQNVIEIGYGETCRTRLLPGFELVVDPHR